MTMSAEIGKLAEALAAAQAVIKGAAKDAENPFFRSKYADLAAHWEACRKALTGNGLAVVQLPRTAFSGEPEVYTFKSKSGEDRSGVRIATTVSVATRLLHVSGEWVETEVSAMLPNGDPQAVGSAITYLRRYGLSAVVGTAPEDDDGEATQRPMPESQRPANVSKDGEIVPVTLDSVYSWGRNKGKTVRVIGRAAFQKTVEEAPSTTPWHRFAVAALEALDEAAEAQRLADVEKMPAALDAPDPANAGLPF